MSKMGEEYNKRLEKYAPDLYEALKAVEYTITVDPSELKDHPITASMVRKVIAKVEQNMV